MNITSSGKNTDTLDDSFGHTAELKYQNELMKELFFFIKKNKSNAQLLNFVLHQ